MREMGESRQDSCVHKGNPCKPPFGEHTWYINTLQATGITKYFFQLVPNACKTCSFERRGIYLVQIYNMVVVW